MKQWYELLYENYAKSYDQEPYAQGTIGECDFIENEIKHDKSLSIIDVGCGTGRHTIELTTRGYNVIGIDLSESQLKHAKEKAKAKNLQIDFAKHDARNLPFNNQFDLAIMLCEGSFPLMETDEMNYEILKNIAAALKPNGKFIFTTLNGLFPIHNSIEKFYDSSKESGNTTCEKNGFDFMTFRDHNIVTVEDDLGNTKTLEANQRYYIPPEITWLLKTVGFSKVDIYGAKLGAYSRNDALTAHDFEMLIIADKRKLNV
ncbi:MAG: class I SAM-dependent methyltransferase [Gammaproteobacteria bacterium]|nr:class I SAM-dependent methyltransferase [Gammaproteobacteria bacterium]